MTNQLEDRIRRLIERHGPVTVAEYMGLALGHRDHGYYQTRDPFGRAGDFTTAPEITQMFGELVGAWCIDAWQRMGRKRFNLIEFGPGRGTLMRDLLRIASRIAPDFVGAATLHLVETSPILRDAQEELLAGYSPRWHESIEDVPEGTAIHVMNEFLDALPVRQFVLTEAGLCERRVGLAGGKFVFLVDRQARMPRAALQPAIRDLANGSIVETCPAALATVREVGHRIAQDGGAALIVDYGYDAPAGEDTFQAVRNHAHVDPLEHPGQADLTAHVDFAAIAEVSRQSGAIVAGPVGQGEFLMSLGIAQRTQTLVEAGDANAEGAMRRLTGADQMGELFKVLTITS